MASLKQLHLDIGLRDSATFANFHPAGNEAALNVLQACAAGSGERYVYLWGAGGVGKTHLLQAVCHRSAEAGAAAYLPLRLLCDTAGPEVFEGLGGMAVVCIDDVETIAGNSAWEHALFNLYNRLRENGTPLLVAGSSSPAGLGLGLADLESRLGWGPVFHLRELSDQGKCVALQMRARGRGLELTEDVAAYLLRRSPRDMNALFHLLERLDEASLTAKRRITIPFVRDLL